MSKTVELEKVIELLKKHVISQETTLVTNLKGLPDASQWIDVKNYLESVRVVYNYQSETENDETLKNVAYLTAIELTNIITGIESILATTN